MFDRRRRLHAAFLVLPLWTSVLAFAAFSAPPAAASTVTTTSSCTNNAQAGTTALPITLSGTATPATAASGDTITLAGATFGIDVPATVLVTGYRLGLLSAGANSIPAEVHLTLLGANTTQGSIALPALSVTGNTTISDPTPANKNSGDETATPLAVSASLPTTTWTASGGNVAISLGDSTTTALVGPGGVISVTFSCTPGTPTPAGCGPAPLAACTGTNPVPAAPFTTVTVGGPGSSTTSTSTTSTTVGSSTTTTTAGSSTTSTTSGSATTTTRAPSPTQTTLTGTGSYATSCTNSVTPDISELAFKVTGSTLSPVTAGSTVKLTNQKWEVTVPGSVLQTGINLGLLKAGDKPAGTATVSVFAPNTKEGTIKAAPVAISVGPIVLDGGQASAVTTSFNVADMTWTAVGGNVGFAMANAAIQVEIGPIKVDFSCKPKDPNITIVTATVSGTTNIPAAGAQVLGTTVSALPRTGSNPAVPAALAIGLIDLGYLFVSSTQPTRRRRRWVA